MEESQQAEKCSILSCPDFVLGTQIPNVSSLWPLDHRAKAR